MSETLTVVYSGLVAQDGVTIGGSFDELDTTLQPLNSSEKMGLVYDLTGPMGSINVVTPTKLTFRTTTAGVPTLGVVSSVYVIDQAAPANYSAVVLPGSRGEITPNNLVCEVQGDYLSGVLTWQSEVDFSYELGRRYSGGLWRDDQALQNNWRRFLYRRLRQTGFSGRVAFTFTVGQTPGIPWYRSSEDPDPARRPRLEATVFEFRENTGHLGSTFANGRSVYCGRSGLPMGARELVEDGWTPGLYVKAAWRDERDMSQEAELPDTEGKVFDEVTT